jgi:hypothetical protein
MISLKVVKPLTLAVKLKADVGISLPELPPSDGLDLETWFAQVAAAAGVGVRKYLLLALSVPGGAAGSIKLRISAQPTAGKDGTRISICALVPKAAASYAALLAALRLAAVDFEGWEKRQEGGGGAGGAMQAALDRHGLGGPVHLHLKGAAATRAVPMASVERMCAQRGHLRDIVGGGSIKDGWGREVTARPR